ncbi:MAG TPA: HDOD domain-containing protein [Polyangiaceae bacterium]|nr:HDOD domain-containing protein [Polyangiaceae bacterium]
MPSLSSDARARVTVFDEPAAVLARLERGPGSAHVVVVADELDNLGCPTLLRQVQKNHPEVIRVVLTELGGLDVFRRIPYAHQFFRRSATASELSAALARCLELRTLLARGELRALVSSSNALPAAPRLYAELIDLLADPRCSMLKVVSVIERDVAMSTRLMQLVSSAFFGMSSQITSLGACVGYLGLEAIRSLVLSAEISQLFPGSVPGLSVEEIHNRSLATSRLARRLASHWADEGQAFVAGLLHGVGQLVLASRAPARFAEALELKNLRGITQTEAEQAVLGATSAEVAAYLLALWGQPLDVVRAIAHQDMPEVCEPSQPGLATVIYLGKRLSQNVDAPLGAASTAENTLNESFLAKVGALDGLPQAREVARRLAS